MINEQNQILHFSIGNAKLLPHTAIFSLPAGFSCPGAKDCLALANRETGKIEQVGEFRCYAASLECIFKNLRAAVWSNFDLLKGKSKREMIQLIENSLKLVFVPYVRIGGNGDYFNQTYFDAWLEVAKNHPEKLFYGYTKSIPFWVKRLHEMPSNFKLVASKGGKYDDLIPVYNLPYSQVVKSEQEAKDLGLEIDHDDSLARAANKPFALLIHGTQPQNTEWSKAWEQVKRSGKGGYSKKKQLLTH